mmetsp:Transcript_3825/g.8241  ORF Transcript_3825/g.8241 Transcript_3825/m.8241 type:complete len:206 (-) Transcript_3825:220-837(-)
MVFGIQGRRCLSLNRTICSSKDDDDCMLSNTNIGTDAEDAVVGDCCSIAATDICAIAFHAWSSSSCSRDERDARTCVLLFFFFFPLLLLFGFFSQLLLKGREAAPGFRRKKPPLRVSFVVGLMASGVTTSVSSRIARSLKKRGSRSPYSNPSEWEALKFHQSPCSFSSFWICRTSLVPSISLLLLQLFLSIPLLPPSLAVSKSQQ